MKLSNHDLAILAVLREDARASLQEISARVGLSTTPCWNRIKKMEAEGVIQGYTVRIDPGAIGFTETVIVQLTLDSHTDETLFEFGRQLEQIPEVLDAYLVSGDYDYYICIAVKDTRDYERLLRESLYRIPGIRHSKSTFVLRTLKESPVPLPDISVLSKPVLSKPAAPKQDRPKQRSAEPVPSTARKSPKR